MFVGNSAAGADAADHNPFKRWREARSRRVFTIAQAGPINALLKLASAATAGIMRATVSVRRASSFARPGNGRVPKGHAPSDRCQHILVSTSDTIRSAYPEFSPGWAGGYGLHRTCWPVPAQSRPRGGESVSA